MKKSTTLKDIADKAGVATMTVSRALRNSPKVSEKRRLEIQRIAKELGYRPDPQISKLMSMLRSAKSQREETVIAYLNTMPNKGDHLNNIHQKTFFLGAQRRADALGYSLQEFWVNEEEMSLERLRNILLARGIEAILLLPYGPGRTELPMDFKDFAVAAIGRSQYDHNFHRA